MHLETKFTTVSDWIYYSSLRQFWVLYHFPKSHLGYLSSTGIPLYCPWRHTLPWSRTRKNDGVPLPDPPHRYKSPRHILKCSARHGLPSMGSQSWTQLKRLSSSSSKHYLASGTSTRPNQSLGQPWRTHSKEKEPPLSLPLSCYPALVAADTEMPSALANSRAHSDTTIIIHETDKTSKS